MGLDTVRLVADCSIFETLNIDRFGMHKAKDRPETRLFETGRSTSYSVSSRKYSPETQSEGAYCQVHPDGLAVLEFSAKALGRDYLSGISENTIERAVANINANSKHWFTVNLHRLVERAHCEKVHNTINIPYDEADIYPLIASLKNTVTWAHKKPDKRFLTSAIFKNKSEALEIYAKLCQLREKDINFFALVGGDIESELARMEHKLENKAQVTKIYNRGGGDIIQAQIPFAHVIKESTSGKILGAVVDSLTVVEPKHPELFNTELFNMISDPNVKLSELQRQLGSDGILEQLGRSEEALREALRIRFNDRSLVSRYTKQILTDCAEAQRIKDGAVIDYMAVTQVFMDKARSVIGSMIA